MPSFDYCDYDPTENVDDGPDWDAMAERDEAREPKDDTYMCDEAYR